MRTTRKTRLKATKENENEFASHDKDMCFCKTAGGDVAASVASAGINLTELENKIKAVQEKKVEKIEELKTAQHTTIKAVGINITQLENKIKAAEEQKVGMIEEWKTAQPDRTSNKARWASGGRNTFTFRRTGLSTNGSQISSAF